MKRLSIKIVNLYSLYGRLRVSVRIPWLIGVQLVKDYDILSISAVPKYAAVS